MKGLKATCPRCGDKITYLTTARIQTGWNSEREYLYAVHVKTLRIKSQLGDREKVIRRKCYLGPVDGYRHAEKLHRLNLTNLSDADYISSAVRALERERELWRLVEEYYMPQYPNPLREPAAPGEGVFDRIDERLAQLDRMERDVVSAINALRSYLLELKQKLQQRKRELGEGREVEVE